MHFIGTPLVQDYSHTFKKFCKVWQTPILFLFVYFFFVVRIIHSIINKRPGLQQTACLTEGNGKLATKAWNSTLQDGAINKQWGLTEINLMETR